MKDLFAYSVARVDFQQWLDCENTPKSLSL